VLLFLESEVRPGVNGLCKRSDSDLRVVADRDLRRGALGAVGKRGRRGGKGGGGATRGNGNKHGRKEGGISEKPHACSALLVFRVTIVIFVAATGGGGVVAAVAAARLRRRRCYRRRCPVFYGSLDGTVVHN